MPQRPKTCHKAVYSSYTSRPSDPDAKYYLAKFGHAQKAKFRFLSSPLFSLFLPHFFCLAGHLVRFILVGKVFRKSFRILRLDGRKCMLVVEQAFHGNFQAGSMLHGFFFLFLWCPWLNCAHSGIVCKISSLCASKRTKLSVTIKTDDVTSGRKDVDPHARTVTGGSGANGLNIFTANE